ncbi:hypothetical protein HHK36_011634 [Tetracentron sinense]|uniref:CGL160/ATPI domain-containing protein n=1 Tax=Tetracentron sinense TaxID=13715 RepID=A0A834ZDB8_TETSI|nr:hypothetical protein HHK36_011634 [Tetracentron sinense]
MPFQGELQEFQLSEALLLAAFDVNGKRSTASELTGEDVLQTFLKERQLNGDFISKVSDILWQRGVMELVDSEASLVDNPQQLDEVMENEDEGGFLKLTKTHEWIAGDNMAPINKKAVAKELQNDSERRKRLELLKYEAIKREMLLLTASIGTACTGYCLVVLSVQAAVSYAAGVLFRIGIRSEDLTNLFERTAKGSIFALSSPRLVIPAAIYGLWALSQHFSSDFFDFQLVPAMLGMFAYKAAALVQVYRDNEDLRLIFPDSEEGSSAQ